MGHYRLSSNTPLRKKQLRDSLRSNKLLQIFIVTIFAILQVVYVISLVWQSSTIFAVVEHNNSLFDSDTTLEEVESYEVDSNGNISFVLMSGEEHDKTDASFVFVENTGSDETFYSEENNVLVAEIANNYSWVMLKESKYWVVFATSILITLCYFLIRKKEWVVFSHKSVRVISIVGVSLVLLSGVFVWLLF